MGGRNTSSTVYSSDYPFEGNKKKCNERKIEVSHQNAVNSTEQIRKQSTILQEKIKKGEVILVTALYDVDTGLVTFDAIK